MKQLDLFCRALIERRITPSLTLLTARGETILHRFSCRRLADGSISIDPSADLIYDVASLTKPLVTAMALLLLTADGRLHPDQAVSDFFPGIHPELRLSHLAAHCAGMPDWYPFYLFPDPFDQQMAAHLHGARPGHHVVYSCPGYMVLKKVLERTVAPEPLETWLKRRIFAACDLTDSAFGGDSDLIASERVMPTEEGSQYERRMAEKRGFIEHCRQHAWDRTGPGITHDLNARWLGGYGGNAGLFTTTADLLTLLNQCDPQTTRLFQGHEKTCEWFWKNLTPWSPAHRTFGFKRNSSLSSAAGRVFSRRAVGHHGFTGCTAWMEPHAGLRMIILTNRIHPQVDEKINFNRIRRRLMRLMKDETEGGGL